MVVGVPACSIPSSIPQGNREKRGAKFSHLPDSVIFRRIPADAPSARGSDRRTPSLSQSTTQ